MTFGSLFAGIGGFDLGLERAGMTCSWQVEIDPYARRVLEKHWPDVRRWDDVRTFPPGGDWGVDLICGGFPCQDISFAGKGVGLAGERSGLWYEFAKVVCRIRPRYVLMENVTALLVRGLDVVLGTMASLGYDSEWTCLSACSVGAPHTRERLFIISYSNRLLWPKWLGTIEDQSSRIQRRDTQEMRRDWLETVTGNAGNADGISDWMDRCRCLGNAVVPQVVEWIGRRILDAYEPPPSMNRVESSSCRSK